MDELEKESHYQQARQKITAMLAGERDEIAQMATVSSILAGEFPYFYWTGFYRLLGGELVVGPYQGTPGCLRINLARGVCGAAASDQKTLIVEDVHQFPGHIACDSASRSEIVVPVYGGNGELIAVLDVDSDQPAAFTNTDRVGLEGIVSAVFGADRVVD
ncbi:MAG: GAF domain-containing protein [Akkermansiaceae bacterium]